MRLLCSCVHPSNHCPSFPLQGLLAKLWDQLRYDQRLGVLQELAELGLVHTGEGDRARHPGRFAILQLDRFGVSALELDPFVKRLGPKGLVEVVADEASIAQ